MPKKFWQFRNQAAGSAELLLYGDISDSSWWGDEVTPKTFADELNALGALTSLTVRINSGGGDVFSRMVFSAPMYCCRVTASAKSKMPIRTGCIM